MDCDQVIFLLVLSEDGKGKIIKSLSVFNISTQQNIIMKYNPFKYLLNNNNNIIFTNICTGVGCIKLNDIADLVKP